MKFRHIFLLAVAAMPLGAADLRLGIIGADTSHVIAFTNVLNDPNAAGHVSGARVVAAFKGGSPDVEESARRVNRYTGELHEKWGVPIVATIRDLCPLVDGLLLESIDGRVHLPQFREAAACGKPVFIDKPLASTLQDAIAIARLGRQDDIRWFSASSLRYSAIADMRSPDMTGAIVWAPGPTEPHQQLDLSWYGIHGIEMLYTLFGPGCVEVTRISSPDADVITGRWSDGRLGTVHLQRPYGKYGAVVFLKGQKLDAKPDIQFSYVPLVKEIVRFMQTKSPPVPNDVTLEMFAFMDAAQKSAAHDGRMVRVPSIAAAFQ